MKKIQLIYGMEFQKEIPTTENRLKVIAKRFSCLFVFLFLLSTRAAYSQDALIRNISLKEFIKQAYENDTVFKEILIDQLNLKYQKALKIPAGDLVISVTNQYNTYLDIDESEVDNSLSLSN